jgi:hypothetical protein
MIVAHSASRLHYVGVQSATFRVTGNGSANIELPLQGPRRIRKILLTTDDNSGVAVSLTAEFDDYVGGSYIAAAKDVRLGANTLVSWDEDELTDDANVIQGSSPVIGIVVAAGGAGAWGLNVQVLFSAPLDGNLVVCIDPQVEGLL